MVASRPAAAGKRKPWAPDRQDIIWIDCDPQVGREMRDVHPFLVLSPRIFNEKTSLVIGLPMTTADTTRTIPLQLPWARRQDERPDKPAMCFATNPSLSTGACATPGHTLSALYPTLCLCRSANGSTRSFRSAEELSRAPDRRANVTSRHACESRQPFVLDNGQTRADQDDLAARVGASETV